MPPDASTNGGGRLRGVLRSLQHRNFRLYFLGQGVSLVGTWMQQLAMTWLVYRLTGAAFWLGVVGFSGQIPTFLIAPLAGVWTDRWNRHRLVILTQTLAMLQAFVLAFLAGLGWIDKWQIVLLSTFLGVVNAFDITARQALLTELVERPEDLANAIALNSAMVNGTRLIGPALAGFVIYAVRETGCFLINGVSYLAVLLALLAMRVPRRVTHHHGRSFFHGLREGFVYAFRFTPIRSILLLLAVVSFAGLPPYTVLMPVFARADAKILGYLMAAAGVGALLGAIYLTLRKTIVGLGIRIALAPAALGVGLIAFALIPSLIGRAVILVVIGFAFMLQMAASNTILQTIVEDDKRGRVMSLYTMAFMGMTPLGSLLVGAVADWVGPESTLIGGGICCVLGTLFFLPGLPALRQRVRLIYVEKGILPEIATGLQTASQVTLPPRD